MAEIGDYKDSFYFIYNLFHTTSPNRNNSFHGTVTSLLHTSFSKLEKYYINRLQHNSSWNTLESSREENLYLLLILSWFGFHCFVDWFLLKMVGQKFSKSNLLYVTHFYVKLRDGGGVIPDICHFFTHAF